MWHGVGTFSVRSVVFRWCAANVKGGDGGRTQATLRTSAFSFALVMILC